MPTRNDSREPNQCTPDKSPSDKKCEPPRNHRDSAQQHHRHRSQSLEKKHSSVVIHKPDCGCRNCVVSRDCEPKKGPFFLERFAFTNSTSGILVPAGATHAKIFMLGGGGGGGRYLAIQQELLHGGGGGGAGGTYEKDCFSVKHGKSFDVTIGAGGLGGNTLAGDGRNGGDTILTYDNHIIKNANGGKGGLFNLNGGFGGKGGCETGAGKDGGDGRKGLAMGRGGAGGDADCTIVQAYGNGGVGGSDATLVAEQPPYPFVQEDYCSSRESRLLSCERERRQQESVLLVGPNGADGSNGYAEISFYRDGSICSTEMLCREPVQHIIPVNSNTTYWVNPDVDLVIVDTSNFSANLNLGRPSSKTHRIIIKLLHQHGLPAFISTSSGGTFAISANNPSVTLFFNNCVWDVEDNFQDIHSFYPTTQQGTSRLVDSYKGTATGFREDTAISADGNTFVIGVYGDDANAGAAFVYSRRDKFWNLQAKLIGSGAIGKAEQGTSVALSADGNTLAVGGPTDNSGVGATWIFVRRDCKWLQQGPKLVKVTSLAQGTSVSLSADGNILAVGAPSTAPNGRVTLYVRSMGAWTESADAVSTTNINSRVISATRQGLDVDLSADGRVLAVGSDEAVIIYNFTPGMATETTLIQTPVSVAFPPIGFGAGAIALSSDGTTLAVGATNTSDGVNNVGAVYIYVNMGGVWTLQGMPLYASPAQVTSGFGSLDFTADGNTLAVGSPNDDGGVGAVYIFTRTAGTWIQREKLVGLSSQLNTHQGSAVSLSSEGNTLVVGNEVQGFAPMFWVYV